METYFTSDLHFGHANIIKYCDRPFQGVTDMDDALITNWNNVVGMGDRVFIVGDFSFHDLPKTHEILGNLKGQKHIVWGNHDKKLRRGTALHGHFASASDMCEIKADGQRITLCHYAMRVWNQSHYGAWHLYGHSHGTLPDDPHALSMDVGVDTHDYHPWSMDEIAERMAKKDFQPVDHHDRNM